MELNPASEGGRNPRIRIGFKASLRVKSDRMCSSFSMATTRPEPAEPLCNDNNTRGMIGLVMRRGRRLLANSPIALDMAGPFSSRLASRNWRVRSRSRGAGGFWDSNMACRRQGFSANTPDGTGTRSFNCMLPFKNCDTRSRALSKATIFCVFLSARAMPQND